MKITPMSKPWRPLTDFIEILPTSLQKPVDDFFACMIAGPGCLYKDIHPLFKQYAPEIYLSTFFANNWLFESFASSYSIFSLPVPFFFVTQLAFTGIVYARMLIELAVIKNEVLIEDMPQENSKDSLEKSNLPRQKQYLAVADVTPSHKDIYNQIIHLFRQPWSQVHTVLTAVGIGVLSLEYFSTSLLVTAMRLLKYAPFFIILAVKFHHSVRLNNEINHLQHWVDQAPSSQEKEGRQKAQMTILDYLKAQDVNNHQYLVEGGVTGSINRFVGLKLCGETLAHKIDLSGLGLTSLPAILFQLTTLMEIDLSNNKLTMFLPEMQKFLYLVKLNIKGNPWGGLPDELRDYPNPAFPNLQAVILDSPEANNRNSSNNADGKCSIM